MSFVLEYIMQMTLIYIGVEPKGINHDGFIKLCDNAFSKINLSYAGGLA